MIKRILVLVALGLCAGITLYSATDCKPISVVNSRWFKFTTTIGESVFVDYLQFKAIDTCGNVTAINQYGTEFSGFRRRLADGSWLYELESRRDCYYLDSFTFLVKECMNPNFYWHFGSYKCKSKYQNCPTCEPLCSTKHKTAFHALKKGENPPDPTEKETWFQYRKWLADD